MTKNFQNFYRAWKCRQKKMGDPQGALSSAAKTITAEYDVPYLAHAMMNRSIALSICALKLRTLDRHPFER